LTRSDKKCILLNQNKCGCGTADINNDGDGIYDCNDECPNDSTKNGPSTYGCGISVVDSNHDGKPNCIDDDNDDDDKNTCFIKTTLSL